MRLVPARPVLCVVLALLGGCGGAAGAAKHPPGRIETMTKAYYTFHPPASWNRTDAPVMTKHEPAWELPRPTGNEPVVALVHRRLSSPAEREGADTNPVRTTIDDWKKRWGAVTVSERTQAIPGAPAGVEAKVFLVEHVKDGTAILAAIVDLSAVDARTRGAYSRVGAGVFELEGPEARVLGARAEFDALVRSVGLSD